MEITRIKTKELWIYDQNNTGGILQPVYGCENSKIVHMVGSYHIGDFNLATKERNIIPKEVYFDGVEKDLDCPCCGDRWEEPFKKNVYIIECEEQLDLLKRYDYYIYSSDYYVVRKGK